MSLILHDRRPLTDRKLPKEIWDMILEERKRWFERHYIIIIKSKFCEYNHHALYNDWTHTWNDSYSYTPKCKGHNKYYHVEHREYSRNYMWLRKPMIFVHMHKHIENKHPSME